jgi:uncharacterized SAM-binding protein YcdF (DUF218 family)
MNIRIAPIALIIAAAAFAGAFGLQPFAARASVVDPAPHLDSIVVVPTGYRWGTVWYGRKAGGDSGVIVAQTATGTANVTWEGCLMATTSVGYTRVVFGQGTGARIDHVCARVFDVFDSTWTVNGGSPWP